MKLLLIGVFLLREIISSQATASESKYDITKALNESIIEIFHSIDSNKIIECLQFYKGKPEDKKYEIENTRKLFRFGSKVYFDDLEIKILDNLELDLQIRKEFLTNKMRIFNRELTISVRGFINLKPNESYTGFTAHFQYKNVSIVATPFPINGHDRKIQIEFLHDYMSNVYFRVRRGFEKISYDEISRLQSIIDPVAPSLIRNYFYTNDQFLQILETVLSHQTKLRIVSAYPDFLHDYNQQLYHYFIPTISKSGLNLNNISLRGLSNFESLNVKEMADHSMYTLLVKKIQGRLTLDIGIEQREDHELEFTIERILITVDREARRICVDARNYLFTQTSPKTSKPSWLSKFSNVIMYMLENGIAASIMPSMEVWRINPNELSNPNHTETSIRQMLREIIRTPTNDNLDHRTNKTTPYNYRISFKNMAIKITSATPCTTTQVQCEFLKNLQINHQINAIPINHIETKPGTPIAINFHGNFTSIKLAVINPNDTKKNNTCEFQIHNDDNIEVELLPTDDNDSVIKKKIDDSLLSMVRERFFRNVVSTICYPIDICDQSLKIIDDYFYRFIDNVLKKCSFRRNNRTTTTTTLTYNYTSRKKFTYGHSWAPRTWYRYSKKYLPRSTYGRYQKSYPETDLRPR